MPNAIKTMPGNNLIKLKITTAVFVLVEAPFPWWR